MLTKAPRGTRGKILRKLEEISPLGLSKLDSVLGSIERVSGLSTAARIGNVYWRVDEPRISAHKRAESVK